MEFGSKIDRAIEMEAKIKGEKKIYVRAIWISLKFRRSPRGSS